MRLDGLETDAQETGDLLVGVTLSDDLDDATFPVCQSRSLLCVARKESRSASETLVVKNGL